MNYACVRMKNLLPKGKHNDIFDASDSHNNVPSHVYKRNLRLKMQFVGNLQQSFAACADASMRGREHSGQLRDSFELRHLNRKETQK